jgi:UDP-glucose 4-epimerase
LDIIRGDVTDINDVRNAFQGCQVIIHLAVLDLRQSIREPQRVNEVIVNGTLNCLDVAIENNVKLFLNCSSSEVYGTAIYVPMDENHPLNPKTPYAAAKIAQDMYVRSYGESFGLPWVTIRPFNIYGPNSHWQSFRGELIPKMIVRALNKEPLIVFGNGNQTRDFNFVEDVASAVLAVAENPLCRNTSINFCSGVETSIQRIAELICKHFDLDTGEFIHRQEPRPGDVVRHYGDDTKFQEIFGSIPRVSIEQGILRTIDWFKALPYTPQELLSQEVARNWESVNAVR